MKIEKVYTTTPTLCKNGVTKPITRVHLESPCPVCLQSMIVDQAKSTKFCTRWICTDTSCGHSERSENQEDRITRIGLRDKQDGILKLTNE